MKINFQTACGIIAKEQGYNTWEELLTDNEAHTHYYQLAADLYVNRINYSPIQVDDKTDEYLKAFHQVEARNINTMVKICYGLSKAAGWHDKPVEDGTRLALIHSEVSEALEGLRRNKMDDHLPHRRMAEVELGDTVIRAFDFAGMKGYDLGGAIVEKLIYNQTRADHKIENRSKEGGKAF